MGIRTLILSHLIGMSQICNLGHCARIELKVLAHLQEFSFRHDLQNSKYSGPTK